MLAVGAGLLSAWGAWFFLARVPVYAVSEAARVEVDRSSFAVAAPVSGQIVSVPGTVGAEVRAGDVLFELDATPQRLALDETRARSTGLTQQLAAHRAEITAAEAALAAARDAGRAGIDRARAESRGAEAAASFARSQAERSTKLIQGGVVSELERQRTDAEAEEKRARADALAIAARHQELQEVERESRDRERIEHIRREAAEVESDLGTARATIERLVNEIDRRVVRAPIDGTLGEAADVRAGAFVREGDRLAAVVPTGGHRIVAHYLPAVAFGRVRTGQPAELRLEGFPWTQYGSLRAAVSGVGGESRDGRVRVELRIEGETASVPLQHGLPGTVEIEVERVSPALLALRAAGRRIRAEG